VGFGDTAVPTRIVFVLPSITRLDIGIADSLTPLIEIALETGALIVD
jgi:hypothetical protein